MSSIQTKEKIQYSKILSTLFSSNAILALSILCLLNNLSIDIYSVQNLLMVVVPASFCFWFLGYIIGKILDRYDVNLMTKTKIDDEKAYEIPSIFSEPIAETEENTKNSEE